MEFSTSFFIGNYQDIHFISLSVFTKTGSYGLMSFSACTPLYIQEIKKIKSLFLHVLEKSNFRLLLEEPKKEKSQN